MLRRGLTTDPGAETADRLLEAAARGGGQAFEALYDRYATAAYSVALGMLRDPQLAQEVTQEVFLSVWRGLASYDASRGSARTWILTLAHHKSVDALRRRRLRDANPLDESMPAADDVAEQAIGRVESERVRKALRGLPDGQREVIALAYYGGYTQREIAERLGVPLGTVKTRTRDGLIRLRALLEREDAS